MLRPRQRRVGYPRSIAVKQAQVPSSTAQSVVVRPLKDGSGFSVSSDDFLAAGLDAATSAGLASALRKINCEIARKLAKARGSEFRRRRSKKLQEMLCAALIVAATAGFALVQSDAGQLVFLLGAGIFLATLAAGVGCGVHAAAARLDSPPDHTALVRGVVQAGAREVEALLRGRGWAMEVPPDCFWLRLAPAPESRGAKTGGEDRLNVYN